MAPTKTEGPRSKRNVILEAAVANFGSVGYEHTKWATIAGEVGIGQTALYHYFESKAHCLLTIMSAELTRYHERFTVAVEGVGDAETALRAAISSAYDISETEALQARILLHHIDMLATPRSSEREEEERVRARELVRVVERDWTGLLERGMDSGEFPRRDPVELGRFVLGLINSVWNWYRPGGSRTLPEVSESVRGACERLVH
ncbi:TetR/AcrR family transcriptional regulator [Dietzia sp. CQ4]|uniref:TetR/AcrR family transcriptional regulator n=1 Tax=Dietzia TaxID=37914 RepID=UPI0015C8C6ED|nr:MULTISPECIES: TetR/AcrR family transcriptional regulator [Dietzia]MBB1032898.1 TetR/AcrR family transcriptional regulator [Dietzia sp. CQ4]MBB1036911.1 TetR/AcrR family transcriptional regulator [Dietzia natronolimnaea]